MEEGIMTGLVCRRLQTSLGELMVAASGSGICRISFPGESSEEWCPWFNRHFGAAPETGDNPGIRRLEVQLEEYFSHRRTSFQLKLDLRGSPFHRSVWRRLRRIPYGRTVTYGELAARLGIPGGSRAVGRASAANPVPIVVPCHRLVGVGGRLVGFGGGIELKERLLELEGIRIPYDVER
jgi:methylated-DNA-[protein]-cysteine S-methyltransferase